MLTASPETRELSESVKVAPAASATEPIAGKKRDLAALPSTPLRLSTGASLTGVIVMLNVLAAVSAPPKPLLPPSFTLSVIWSALGGLSPTIL